jgi:hypothetical protein
MDVPNCFAKNCRTLVERTGSHVVVLAFLCPGCINCEHDSNELDRQHLNHMQTVLTVLPAKELDLVKARELASRLKRRGLIADWQPLVEAKGIKIILKLDTSPRRRSAITDEFVQVGYEVHDDI